MAPKSNSNSKAYSYSDFLVDDVARDLEGINPTISYDEEKKSNEGRYQTPQPTEFAAWAQYLEKLDPAERLRQTYSCPPFHQFKSQATPSRCVLDNPDADDIYYDSATPKKTISCICEGCMLKFATQEDLKEHTEITGHYLRTPPRTPPRVKTIRQKRNAPTITRSPIQDDPEDDYLPENPYKYQAQSEMFYGNTVGYVLAAPVRKAAKSGSGNAAKKAKI